MAEPHELSALEQAAAIRAGEISPTELTRHYLERIDTLDGEIGAYLTICHELALDLAAQAERTPSVSPLHGVPIAIKDLVHVEDVRCTLGSAAFEDQVSDGDDHVVARLKAFGMVILGKTNTPEFGLPCYTENAIAPATRSPGHPGYSPGGSSGGSAAAVAAGLAPLAHGTDAGGSIRIPASACGLVGIKPSRGRVSDGPLSTDSSGLSVHGPLARTVADAAALLDVMAGSMPGDVYAAPALPPGETFLGYASRRPRRLRIAGLRDPLAPGVELDPECAAAYHRAAETLGAAGHELTELELPADPDLAEAFGRVWSAVAASIEVDPQDEGRLTPFTRYMRARGRTVGGAELLAALTAFRGLAQMLTDLLFVSYDMILTPTLAQPPALIGAFSGDDAEADFASMTAFMPYTPMYNITGFPAVTLPLHRSADGLPVGVMLGGAYGQEALLLSVAAELESEI